MTVELDVNSLNFGEEEEGHKSLVKETQTVYLYGTGASAIPSVLEMIKYQRSRNVMQRHVVASRMAVFEVL